MGLSVTQIDEELKELLGIDDSDVSPTKRLLWINRSFWEITSKFDFREKEATYTFPTVVGTSEYNVPGDLEAMQYLSIRNTVATYPEDTRLLRMTKEEYINTYRSDLSQQDFPARYYREADKVTLWPVPNDAYTIIMKYLKDLADLVAGGQVILPQEWHELILFGAAYRGFLVSNDKVSAEFYRNQQSNLTVTTIPTESKEERDSSYAAVSVVTRRSGHEANAPSRALWKGHR